MKLVTHLSQLQDVLIMLRVASIRAVRPSPNWSLRMKERSMVEYVRQRMNNTCLLSRMMARRVYSSIMRRIRQIRFTLLDDQRLTQATSKSWSTITNLFSGYRYLNVSLRKIRSHLITRMRNHATGFLTMYTEMVLSLVKMWSH